MAENMLKKPITGRAKCMPLKAISQSCQRVPAGTQPQSQIHHRSGCVKLTQRLSFEDDKEHGCKTTENRNRQLARSTLIVMAAFAIAKIISLAQTVIIAQGVWCRARMGYICHRQQYPGTNFHTHRGRCIGLRLYPNFQRFSGAR